jgi:hypothetical protein
MAELRSGPAGLQQHVLVMTVMLPCSSCHVSPTFDDVCFCGGGKVMSASAAAEYLSVWCNVKQL